MTMVTMIDDAGSSSLQSAEHQAARVAACAALALGGCVTAEEMAAQTAAYDDNECHSYGAATGTDAYFTCRMTKAQQRIEASDRAAAQVQHGLDMIATANAPPTPVIVAPNLY